MTARSRILLFGAAAVLVIAGVACAALVGGLTGELLTIVLISGGLAGALLLVFLEVGLGEERDVAREQARRRRRESMARRSGGHARVPRWPRRPG